MISGILKPTKGKIYIFDKDLQEELSIKNKIGVVPEQPYVYGNMSAHDYLSFFADLYKLKDKENRIAQLLSDVNLSDSKNKKIKAFSKGMKQRVNIARALLNNPEILILDEPTSGLDPVGIKEIRDIIYKQRQEGKTIILSSHLLYEIEKVCNVVAIINKGEILKIGAVDEILSEVSDDVEIEIEVDELNNSAVAELKNLHFVKEITTSGNRIKIITSHQYRKEISKCITMNGCTILEMHESKKGLENEFIKIIKNDVN